MCKKIAHFFDKKKVQIQIFEKIDAFGKNRCD